MARSIDSLVKEYCRMKNEKPGSVKGRNNGRHRRLEVGDEVLRVKYSDEPFNKFSQVFADVGNYVGKGASMNKKELVKACNGDVDSVLVGYKDGRVFKMDAKRFLEWAIENDTIRTTKNQVNEEETVSVPLDIMERIDQKEVLP